MEHYERSIRAVGAASGYSTEHPERLHIDFAKLAYSSSNKQSTYLKQMTRWLDRDEAVHCFAAYVNWKQSLDTSSAVPQHESTAGPAAQADAPPSQASNITGMLTGINQFELEGNPDSDLDLGSDSEESDAWAQGYRVAKKLAFQSLTVEKIPIRLPSLPPLHHLSHISAYKQVKIRLPLVSQVSPLRPVDIIRASRAYRHPNGLIIPASLSTVLARDPGQPVTTMRLLHTKPLQGIRVACMRLIFNLPVLYDATQYDVKEPLAYVEWFTPFRQMPDDVTGMYVVSASTHQH
ncbi:hypothetical protein BN946_scf184962.g4 [Trametes cinnabarina]|uniref:Uncharacterized protein n=1 Tax=Pycnoporus cinnabarinus TaxID=5643 RepID=A0A060SCV2_PYCCI|nr:hypothetical protein BN946_scf184962.g4 [Trametes cinnabarina]